MNIFEEIKKTYREKPGYGVTFSIEPECYDCNVDVYFSDNVEDWSGGCHHNWQTILLDGEAIGILHEWRNGKLFDPMCTEFIVRIDPEEESKYQSSPHYEEGEFGGEMHFANLQDLVDFVVPPQMPLNNEQSDIYDRLRDDFGFSHEESLDMASEYSGWINEILSM